MLILRSHNEISRGVRTFGADRADMITPVTGHVKKKRIFNASLVPDFLTRARALLKSIKIQISYTF